MHDTDREGVAVGFFDGVHLGHRAILSRARIALTFRNHPLSVVAPERAPRLIMPFHEREQAIRDCGVEKVVSHEFTPEFAAMEPEDFIFRYVKERKVWCGENWRFGKGGRGDAALLALFGYEVEVVPFATWRGERVSSTRVRAALEAGEMEEAAAMLGRPWRLAGRVVHGKGLGRKIGFPTVNVVSKWVELHLPHGAYVAECAGRRAVANWGFAPTAGAKAWTRPTLEVHFLGDPPPESPRLEVSLLKFLRPERTFDSLDALRAQLAADCDAGARF